MDDSEGKRESNWVVLVDTGHLTLLYYRSIMNDLY